jgi:hypothetical protein
MGDCGLESHNLSRQCTVCSHLNRFGLEMVFRLLSWRYLHEGGALLTFEVLPTQALSKRFGSVKGGSLSAMQYELLVDWRERARERQEAEEERRRMAAEIARAEEMKRMGLVCESTAMHPWCILGGSDALVFDSWTLREEEDVLSICFDENADESTRMQVLGVAAALGRMVPHPSSAVGYHYHQGKGIGAGMVDDDVDFGDEVGGGFAGGDWPVH